MFGEPVFYFGQIRKMVVVFGTIFNDIHIKRFNQAGQEIDFLKVPLAFSSKDKLLARADQDPTIQRPYSILLPRMGFDLLKYTYDPSRKIPSLNRLSKVTADDSHMSSQYAPVPYNFHFNLYIAVKNVEDGFKIVEQILPYFTPDWTPKVDLIPEMNIVHDIPIVLTSISSEDKYDGKMEQRQIMTYTLSFVMKGYLYGPIKTIPVIKEVNINFRLPDVNDNDLISAVGVTPIGEYIQCEVAELANGSPTTDITQSIPLAQISANSDYGISTIIVSNDEINRDKNGT
ncbi:MAG: tail sheath stabilizer and completion protein [Legionella sp.]|uniref:tail sheath stabilizer and completion protein n=1 Tax=Legionella sp. TaxID=459 RepID=UPI0028430411|nr:tail sheath stabilizer and completion protein [Legionella sp.]